MTGKVTGKVTGQTRRRGQTRRTGRIGEIERRPLLGGGASGAGLAARVAEQILLVPILLGAWSVELYGEWLLIAAIPVYLALSDMGFVAAGSNELARRSGTDTGPAPQGAETRLRRFFGDYVSTCLGWTLGLAGLFLTLALVLPLHRWLGLEALSRPEAVTTFVLLICNTLVAQNALALLAGLRAQRLFHIGLLLRAGTAFARLGGVALLVLVWDAGPVGAAALLLGVTLTAYAMEAALLWQSGLPPVWRPFARRAEPMAPLLKLGLEFMLMPLSQAIVLQGMIVLVGTTLGAVAVAVYATHRTLTRLTAQMLQLAVAPLQAEAGLLQSGPDLAPDLGRLLGTVSRVTLWASVGVAGVLFTAGPWIFEVWTGGRLPFVPWLFAGLILSTVFEGVWRIAATLRLGTNRHRPVVWGYLGLSLAGLGLAWGLAHRWGLAGVPWALAAVDLAMCVLVIRVTVALLGIGARTYLCRLMVPPLAEAVALLHGLLHRLRHGTGRRMKRAAAPQVAE